MVELPRHYEAELERLVATLAIEPYKQVALEAVKTALRDALEKFRPTRFEGIDPSGNNLGIRALKAMDFNLSTFRKNYTSTGWQEGPIANATTSRLAYIVIFGYRNLEPTPRVREVQWDINGRKTAIFDLTEILETEKQEVGTEPFILEPGTANVTMYVDVESTGYDWTEPIGVVIAPRKYLISRTFLSE